MNGSHLDRGRRRGYQVVSDAETCEARHDVHGAENGVAASRIMQEARFDLVITDIIMPDKEGLQTIMG